MTTNLINALRKFWISRDCTKNLSNYSISEIHTILEDKYSAKFQFCFPDNSEYKNKSSTTVSSLNNENNQVITNVYTTQPYIFFDISTEIGLASSELENGHATIPDSSKVPILESDLPQKFMFWIALSCFFLLLLSYSLDKKYPFNAIATALAIVILPILIFSWGLYIFKTIYYRKKGNAILIENGILQAGNMKGIKKYNIINMILTLMNASRSLIGLSVIILVAGCIQK